MSGKVTDKDTGWREMLARVRALSGDRRVRVGVLADAPKDEDKPVKGSASKKARTRAKVAKKATEAAVGGREKYTLLQVAIVHEFGAGPVPARSFIRATVDERRADILKLQVALARQVLQGKLTPDQALDQLGAKVAAWVKARIVAGIAPPLKPATIKRKGGKKATPLVDTGQLRSSITWAVEGAAA